jgi:glycerol-3-phosphate dehydrogenase
VNRPVLDRAPYDLIVIGAGVNGLGVAQDAALRGLRVVLLEKEDLCSGVSAWSGRLVHGGLRYLEQYDFRLVRESLRERERLFRLAPHLVKPVPLMMPLYQHNRRSSWLVELGMLTYDALSLRKKPPTHRVLTRRRALKRFPGMSQSGLSGAAVFFDGQVEYAERLCVELAVDAQRNGAHIMTHAQVTAPILDGGRVVGVRYTDHLTGDSGEVRGAVVYNVAGPWIDRVFTSPGVPDQPRLNGGTKGSHLIVKPFPGAPKDVVYYESRKDGRLVLVIPWLGRYMLGTTDIRFEDDPDGARCDIGEAEYLMGEVNSLVPDAKLTLDDVLYTFSGVRPLPYVPESAESSVPRTHILHDHAGSGLPGVVTVVGGKLSTYRQLAEDAVDDAYRRLKRKAPRCPTRNRPLPGAQVADLAALTKTLAVRSGLPERSVRRLVALYGSRALDVWRLAEGDSALGGVIDPGTGLVAAEVVFAVDDDLAATLTDVMARRLILAFEPDHGFAVLDPVVEILRARLGWDDAASSAQITGYRQWLERLAVPDPAGPRSESFGAGVVVKER